MRACIFCGKPAKSGEHLWSAAIHGELKKFVPRESYKRSYKQHTSSVKREVVKWAGMPTYDTTIKCVCGDCNSGWMNRSDESVRDDLLKMMRGIRVVLQEEAVRRLSRWIAMKIIVREHFDPDSCIMPNDLPTNFYLTGNVPLRMQIGLAWCGDKEVAAAFNRHYTIDRDDETGAVAEGRAYYTFGLGNLIVFAEYSNIDLPMSRFPSSHVRTLWPSSGRVKWPWVERANAFLIDILGRPYHGGSSLAHAPRDLRRRPGR